MRPTARKIFGFAHLWLGLVSGLVIFIVAITGATYVFYNEISEFAEHDILFVKPQQNKIISLSEVQRIGIMETERIAGNKLPKKWDWTSILSYHQPDRSFVYSSREYKKYNVLYQVYINPYNGSVIKSCEGDSVFWETVIGLHTQLLLGTVGGYIVDFSTLAFLFMIISGMVLWWPKSKAAAKKRFTVKLSASPKRLNYDLHNILGFYMCWIVIFCVLTGLVWAFQWAKSAMYFLADGKQPVEISVKVNEKTEKTDNLPAIDHIPAQLARLYPQYFMEDISLSQSSKEPFSLRIWKKEGQSGFEDNLSFHPITGKLIQQVNFRDKSTGAKLEDITSDLHYGWIFGLPSKLLMFFACLIAASLPVTGVLIWIGRNKKNKKPSSVEMIKRRAAFKHDY